MRNNLKTLLGYLLEEETVSQRPFMLSLDNLVAHRDSLFDAYEHCVYRNRCSESSGPIVVAEIEDGKYQLIDGYHRLIEHLLDRGDGSLDDEMGNEDAGEFGEPDPNNPNPNLDGEDPLSNKPEVDEFQIEDDPDRQGNVHYVKSAHLVYRREQEDGTFEELWIYNVGDEAERKAEEIIRDILAGTDIDDTQIRSEDGAQEYTLWTIGNAQMLKITGLPA